MVTPRIEFFFSPGSRYSYLAASQMPGLEAATGCALAWRPLFSPEVRALRGRDPFAGEPLSGQYDWTYRQRDAEAWAAYYGIPFREPPRDGTDYRLLSRAAEAARQLGAAASYGGRICHAVYGSERWPLDETLCVQVAAEVGLDAEVFRTRLQAMETDRALSATAQEACARGVFGVPTFLVDDQLFWGNDRIVLLRHYLGRCEPS